MFIKFPNAQNKKGRSSYKYGVRLFLLSVRFSMDRFLFKKAYFRLLGAKRRRVTRGISQICALPDSMAYERI